MNRRLALSLIAVLAASALSACAPRKTLKDVRPFMTDPQAMTALLSGGTMMDSGGPHGIQVEYYDPDGASWLWYAGNTGIVRGEWRLVQRTDGSGLDICFRYQANSYNPVTRTPGGQWECTLAGSFGIFSATEIVSGDVFDLSSGEIPFVLESRKGPVRWIEDLLKEAGRPEVKIQRRWWTRDE